MQKNRLRDFDIEVSHVKEHTLHKFEFQLNDSFFALFEDALIQKGLVQVDVQFEKTPLLIRMNFILNGVVELVCDRSLDTFEQPISSEQLLLFKFTEEEEGEIRWTSAYLATRSTRAKLSRRMSLTGCRPSLTNISHAPFPQTSPSATRRMAPSDAISSVM